MWLPYESAQPALASTSQKGVCSCGPFVIVDTVLLTLGAIGCPSRRRRRLLRPRRQTTTTRNLITFFSWPFLALRSDSCHNQQVSPSRPFKTKAGAKGQVREKDSQEKTSAAVAIRRHPPPSAALLLLVTICPFQVFFFFYFLNLFRFINFINLSLLQNVHDNNKRDSTEFSCTIFVHIYTNTQKITVPNAAIRKQGQTIYAQAIH